MFDVRTLVRTGGSAASSKNFVFIDKKEVALVLNIPISLPEGEQQIDKSVEHEVTVSETLCSVSEQHTDPIIQEGSKVLTAQGISYFHCLKFMYKLLPLLDYCWVVILPRNLD